MRQVEVVDEESEIQVGVLLLAQRVGCRPVHHQAPLLVTLKSLLQCPFDLLVSLVILLHFLITHFLTFVDLFHLVASCKRLSS